MALVPVWEIIEQFYAEKGKKITPRKTLALCRKITEDINEDLARRQRPEGDEKLDA